MDYETKVFPKLRFDRGLDDPEPAISMEEKELIERLLEENR
jgi:hypothetical protein